MKILLALLLLLALVVGSIYLAVYIFFELLAL